MNIEMKYVRIGVIVLAAGMVLYFLWLVRAGLYPFVLGILLAYLLNPLVMFFEHKGMKRSVALLLIYGLIFLIFWFIAVKFIPFLVRELESFAGDLPQMIRRVENLLDYWQLSYESIALPLSMREAINESIISLSSQLNLFVAKLVQGILQLFTYLIGIVVSPVLAFYLLSDWQGIKKNLLLMVPRGWQKEVFLICRSISQVLDGVIRGQLFISLFVGTLITLGLWMFDVRYALLIGILAGVLDVIPYFGAIIGAVPAIGVAFLYSPMMALKVLILFFVVHQMESALIQPKIIGAKVGLHPLSVIFFVFIGGELGGLLGMLLCVPLAAIAKVLLKHLLKLTVEC